ncbi:MAG: hypothetical protein K0R15_1673 [Clostridiales bacterium]|jgi:hypothetical protein|nr:hypothetical protein [Clostridiales bacterium]
MKKRKYITLLLTLSLSLLLITGCSKKNDNNRATSNKPVEINNSITDEPATELKENIYYQDAMDVIETVEITHPAFAIGKIPKSYEDEKQEYLGAITKETTPYDFAFLTRKYLSVLGDLHTGVNGQQSWYFMNINCYADGDKLYLLDDDGKVTKNSIINIDGIPIQNIFKTVDLYFSAENPTGINFNHSVWSVYKPMLQFAGCDVSKESIKVTIDENGTMVEKRIKFMEKLYYDAYSYTTEIQSELMGDIYYIDLNTCALDNHKFNEENEKLKDAIHNGISKVIIDVRNNGGGNAEYCRQLLKTLGMTAPEYGSTFRRSPLSSKLRGWTETSGIEQNPVNTNVVRNDNINLVILTNEYTFSSATMLGVYVQDGKLGTIIGRTSINAPSCYSDVVQYETKNSEIFMSISYLKLDRPDTKADQNTLTPDIVTDVGEDSLQRAIAFLDNK